MERLRKFLRLPAVERWILIKSALLLEAIKLGMRLLPFRTLRRLISVLIDAPVKPPCTDHPSTERMVWAVEAASRHTLGVKTCLAKALATQVLLARRGYAALLHIGVILGEQRQLQAHAWVVSEEGKIVIGGTELGCYTPLAVFGVERPQ